MYLEIKNIDNMMYKSSVQLEVFKTFLKKKIGKHLYKNLDPNENIVRANFVDSQDLIEIIVFMEKKLSLKIDIYKIIHFVEGIYLVKKKNYKVNSFHAKSLDKIGNDLTPFLMSEDDIVEGIYNLEKKIIGIQFHMENQGVSSELTNQIMEKFANL